MDRFNPFQIPKPNKVVGAIKALPLWFRPNIGPGTSPEDWKVLKLSGDRTGYIESKFLQ